MHHKIAKTKSLAAAWGLIERLQAALPCHEFVVVMRRPDDGAEVHPVKAFHPLDDAEAKVVVAQYLEDLKATIKK